MAHSWGFTLVPLSALARQHARVVRGGGRVDVLGAAAGANDQFRRRLLTSVVKIRNLGLRVP